MSKKEMQFEHKSFSNLETKVVDEDEGVVEHIFAVFGNKDLGGDVIHPGAFTKTISERGHAIKILDQHRTDTVLRVLGKPLSMKEIGVEELPASVREAYPNASGGMLAKSQFFLDTPEGAGAFKRIKAGAIDQWSFGYDVMDSDFETVDAGGEEKQTIRNIRAVKLYEISPVLWGMNPATATVGVKDAETPDDDEDLVEALFEQGIDAVLEHIDAIKSKLGELSQEYEEKYGEDSKTDSTDEAETKAGPEAQPPTSGSEDMLKEIDNNIQLIEILEEQNAVR